MAKQMAAKTTDGDNDAPVPLLGNATRRSLNLPADLDFDGWREVGKQICAAERLVGWWVGDWWAFGEHRYGDRAKAAADGIFGRSLGSLMNAGSVARKIETSRRREVLSFSHHAEVASLPPEHADEMLDRAENEGMSQKQLRAAVKEKKMEMEIVGTPAQPAVEPAKSSGRAGPRITVPEGKSVEDLCRDGLRLLESGATSNEISSKLRVSQSTWAMMRNIVVLADRTDLPAKDAAIARASIDEMNGSGQVGNAYQKIEAIVRRVWGNSNNRRGGTTLDKAEARRLEAFDRAVGILTHTCGEAQNIEVPHLSKEKADEAAADLNTAINAVKALRQRILEIHK